MLLRSLGQDAPRQRQFGYSPETRANSWSMRKSADERTREAFRPRLGTAGSLAVSSWRSRVIQAQSQARTLRRHPAIPDNSPGSGSCHPALPVFELQRILSEHMNGTPRSATERAGQSRSGSSGRPGSLSASRPRRRSSTSTQMRTQRVSFDHTPEPLPASWRYADLAPSSTGRSVGDALAMLAGRTQRANDRLPQRQPSQEAYNGSRHMQTYPLSAHTRSSRPRPRSSPTRPSSRQDYARLGRPASAQRPAQLLLPSVANASEGANGATMLRMESTRQRGETAQLADPGSRPEWDNTALLPSRLGSKLVIAAPQLDAKVLQSGWLLRSHNDDSSSRRQWKRQWVRCLAQHGSLLVCRHQTCPPAVQELHGSDSCTQGQCTCSCCSLETSSSQTARGSRQSHERCRRRERVRDTPAIAVL